MSALTKILIVLQLIFSLVCSVLLVLMVSRTENYKAQVTDLKTQSVALGASFNNEQSAKNAALAKQTTLQTQLDQARVEETKTATEATAAATKAELAALDQQNQIAQLHSQVATLQAAVNTAIASNNNKDKELAELRPQVAELNTKYNEIYRVKQEGDNQLRAAELAIRKLQEIIANQPATGGGGGGTGAVAPVGSGDQIQVLQATSAGTAGKVNGQISNVADNLGRTLIEMPLGTRDGIQVGTKMYVYRASGYVGDATVQRVTPDQSVAVIISTKAGETVQKGDFVSTVGQ